MSAFVIAARRTAICPRGGAFARLSIEGLAVPVVQAVLADAGMDGARVDEVILSNALGAGGNPARRVALAAGLPERVAGLSIDRQCAGGLDALRIAAAMIGSGQAEVVIAGGAESYSRRPLRFATDPDGGPAVAYDQAPFTPWPDRDPDMAQAADALAVRLGISRAMQDAWAVTSHARARAAGSPEIVALEGVARDAFARVLTPVLAARAKVVTGSITAANAAVAADGAALCVVVSARIAAAFPRAMQIVRGATLGGDPMVPGLAPVAAIRAVMGDAHLVQAEVMEAYAVQAMACVAAAGLDPAIVNMGGGALAQGHAVGASGAVLAVRLFHHLRGGHGLAAIAAAGGIGAAMLFRRDEA